MSCYTTSSYHNSTTSYAPSSSSTKFIRSTMSSHFGSAHPSIHSFSKSERPNHEGTQCEHRNPSQSRSLSTRYHHQYSSGNSNSHTSHGSKFSHTPASNLITNQIQRQFATSSPTSVFPSTRKSVSASSSRMCAPGIDINNPGLFELWSYAPGICDLDNKVVTSSVSSFCL